MKIPILSPNAHPLKTGPSAAVRPLLRLAGVGAAAAAGSGAFSLAARASSTGGAATSEIAKVLVDPKWPAEFPFGKA